jgi:signal transduction histidine kinase
MISTNNHTAPIQESDLRALAPLELPSYRDSRYTGDRMSLALADFAEPDQQIIRQLYATLNELMGLIKRRWDALDDPDGSTELIQFVQRMRWTTYLEQVRDLGNATYPTQPSELLRKVVHDIKGGGFMALSLYLQMLDMGLEKPDDVPRMFFLTRDHLKIMRNAIQNIDPEAQARDASAIDHSVNLLVEKWNHAHHRVQDTTAEVFITNTFDGVISERCLEFSALDRVIYNLINNATRHTADHKVYFAIVPLDDEQPQHVRFVIYNQVRPEQRATLQERFAGSLGELFRGGFTTGGTGVGLRICADFVNNAYGIHSFEKGLSGGYFGARLLGDYFVNWVHWPMVAD